jgi:hypothetical protein
MDSTCRQQKCLVWPASSSGEPNFCLLNTIGALEYPIPCFSLACTALSGVRNSTVWEVIVFWGWGATWACRIAGGHQWDYTKLWQSAALINSLYLGWPLCPSLEVFFSLHTFSCTGGWSSDALNLVWSISQSTPSYPSRKTERLYWC